VSENPTLPEGWASWMDYALSGLAPLTSNADGVLECAPGAYIDWMETCERARAELEALRARTGTLLDERDDARMELASVTDWINTFARENGKWHAQAQSPHARDIMECGDAVVFGLYRTINGLRHDLEVKL
jgi:hypothetical protein